MMRESAWDILDSSIDSERGVEGRAWEEWEGEEDVEEKVLEGEDLEEWKKRLFIATNCVILNFLSVWEEDREMILECFYFFES